MAAGALMAAGAPICNARAAETACTPPPALADRRWQTAQTVLWVRSSFETSISGQIDLHSVVQRQKEQRCQRGFASLATPNVRDIVGSLVAWLRMILRRTSQRSLRSLEITPCHVHGRPKGGAAGIGA